MGIPSPSPSPSHPLMAMAAGKRGAGTRAFSTVGRVQPIERSSKDDSVGEANETRVTALIT